MAKGIKVAKMFLERCSKTLQKHLQIIFNKKTQFIFLFLQTTEIIKWIWLIILIIQCVRLKFYLQNKWYKLNYFYFEFKRGESILKKFRLVSLWHFGTESLAICLKNYGNSKLFINT